MFLAVKHNISLWLSARAICTEKWQAHTDLRDHPDDLCVPARLYGVTNAKSSFDQSIEDSAWTEQRQFGQSFQALICAICTYDIFIVGLFT
jgi:hypothetical protein